jgi:ATP-dependent 26S proteasome regulatory subunit
MPPAEKLHRSGGDGDNNVLPVWAEEIRRSYLAAAASVFLVHGVRDDVLFQGEYLPLTGFLHQAFCGDKLTVFYDLAGGISFPSPQDEEQFHTFLNVYQNTERVRVDLRESYRPELSIPLLEHFLTTRDSAAVIIDYVDKLAPRADGRLMTFAERRLVTTLRRWANEPRLLRRNNFVFMLADSLADVNEDLYGRIGGARVIAQPLPDYDQRLAYINGLVAQADDESASALALSPEAFATNTDGLTRVQIARLMQRTAADQQPVTVEHTAEYKREVISQEIGDLISFMRPKLGLDAVAGVARQKELLVNTALALREGRTAVVPKGILLVGPPGCGKTFTMECFAHDAGIPFVELRNIFSKYVGSTEGNFERVFHYLEAMAPVFVFIDEFDQSYGRRVTSDSDSGVSRRVFGMFNSFLSDESHQGRILFGAATNRPDLIDPSTLRAGRFDMKLPFLLPDAEAREAILRVSLRNLGISDGGIEMKELGERTAGYSGADLREVCHLARRTAAFAGRQSVDARDLEFAVSDYIAPTAARGEEIEYMQLLAVAACTSRSLLPDEYLGQIESGGLYRRLRELELGLG